MIASASHPVLSGSPYRGYVYAYPHKTAYRSFDPPRPLADVWAVEPRSGLFLYIHVPFCEQMCLYCGCHTKATRQSGPVEAYAGRLVEEIKLIAGRAGCRRVVHLHWGGGTPSILGPDLLRELVGMLDVHFDLTALREHAFELGKARFALA